METKEIVHSLRCCISAESCDSCDFFGTQQCVLSLKKIAANRLEELEAEIADLKKHLSEKPEWVSMEDRLPEVGEDVLIKYENNLISGFLQLGNEWCCYTGNGWVTLTNTSSSPTHWMPLPDPPKPKKKVKTYKDVFFEAFPNALLAKEIDGIPAACRSLIFGKSNKCSMDPNCEDCWNQPYPEEGGEE